MRTAYVSIVVLALAACGQPEATTYPPQYELNFMRSCQAQGAPIGFCSCSWEKIEREIPPADFAAFERLPASEQETHPLRAKIQAYAGECRSEPVGPPDDPPAP